MVIAIWSDKMSVLLLAALLAVGLSKPQLSILVLPGFMIYRIRTYGFQKAAQLILYLIGCILLLTVPLFFAYPKWFPDFMLNVQQNPSWAHPSSLHFLRDAVPHIAEVLWSVLALVIFAVNIWLWTTLPGQDAIFWSLALTLLITPYVWTWDFVMLLPLFVSSFFKAKTKISLAILLGGYLVCWGLIVSMKIRGQVNDSLFWWVPWLLVAIIIGSKHLKIQFNRSFQFAGWNRKKVKGLVYTDHVEKAR